MNLRVKVVTFDADVMAQAYEKETGIGWPLLLDEDRLLYQAYEMSSGSWWAIFNPISIWSYLKLIATGTRPGSPGKDWRQLGGDVLIDPDGNIQLHYVSTQPHDRPSVESIFSLVEIGS